MRQISSSGPRKWTTRALEMVYIIIQTHHPVALHLTSPRQMVVPRYPVPSSNELEMLLYKFFLLVRNNSIQHLQSGISCTLLGLRLFMGRFMKIPLVLWSERDYLCSFVFGKFSRKVRSFVWWCLFLGYSVMAECNGSMWFYIYYGRVVFISRQSNNERGEMVVFMYSQKENALFVLDLE